MIFSFFIKFVTAQSIGNNVVTNAMKLSSVLCYITHELVCFHCSLSGFFAWPCVFIHNFSTLLVCCVLLKLIQWEILLLYVCATDQINCSKNWWDAENYLHLKVVWNKLPWEAPPLTTIYVKIQRKLNYTVNSREILINLPRIGLCTSVVFLMKCTPSIVPGSVHSLSLITK